MSVPTAGYSEVYNPTNYRLESAVDHQGIGRDYIDEAPPVQGNPVTGGGVDTGVRVAARGGQLMDPKTNENIGHGVSDIIPTTSGVATTGGVGTGVLNASMGGQLTDRFTGKPIAHGSNMKKPYKAGD